MMPVQPQDKTPKHWQMLVDEPPGLLATNSLFYGISFTFSLPV